MDAEGAEGMQTGRMERGLAARWGSHPGSESLEAGPCACQWDTGLGRTTGPSPWTGSWRCCSEGWMDMGMACAAALAGPAVHEAVALS